MQALTSSNSNESGRILAPDKTLRANPSLNQVASERIGKTQRREKLSTASKNAWLAGDV
jgi:hypothetical protein